MDVEGELFEPSLEDMIVEVKREITMRQQVYPRHVLAKKLSQSTATRRIMVMEALQAYLEKRLATRDPP